MKTVLVVDDNHDNSEIVCKVLKRMGLGFGYIVSTFIGDDPAPHGWDEPPKE
jgi:CheY-like chemotaxis protein